MTASCYTTLTKLVITHRFLILRVSRQGEEDVYVRLDRLVSPSFPFTKLLRRAGKAPAHDKVSISP